MERQALFKTSDNPPHHPVPEKPVYCFEPSPYRSWEVSASKEFTKNSRMEKPATMAITSTVFNSACK